MRKVIRRMSLLLIILLICCTNASIIRQNGFELNVVHFNDFHARFEETSPRSTKCVPEQNPCIAGFPRLYTAIKELKKSNPNAVILNAGDSFQGTLWYNLLRWNVTQHFMNKLPLDAHALGNHEFDHSIEGVVPYIKALKAPVVASNIDDSKEPTMQGLYNKSIVIERNGQKIGIIGVIIKSTEQLSDSGKLKFTDEIKAVKKEAERLSATGINKIIVLSHAGLDVDMEIAMHAGPDIDIIVGGHTHSLLYTGTPPNNDTAVDVYPIKVVQPSGTTVLIVQALAFAKYVGNLTVHFDNRGLILDWEGAPIFMDHSIKQDEDILKEMEPYKHEVDLLGKRQVGTTKVHLSRKDCPHRDCNIGNMITDSFVDYFVNKAEENYWTYTAAVIINQGGIRADINIGNITYEDIIIAQPFGNAVYSFDIKGQYILEALEFSVNATAISGKLFYSFGMLQMSGIHVVFNVSKPIGQRIVQAKIRCAKCEVPEYYPINAEETYRLATVSFLGTGGDGFLMISNNMENMRVWDLDVDILEKYIKRNSPITHGIEQRITILQ